jgi:hypothetical protein
MQAKRILTIILRAFLFSIGAFGILITIVLALTGIGIPFAVLTFIGSCVCLAFALVRRHKTKETDAR